MYCVTSVSNVNPVAPGNRFRLRGAAPADLRIDVQLPVDIAQDNQSTIKLANAGRFNARTRHITNVGDSDSGQLGSDSGSEVEIGTSDSEAKVELGGTAGAKRGSRPSSNSDRNSNRDNNSNRNWDNNSSAVKRKACADRV